MFTFIQTMSAHWPYDYPYMPEVDVPGGDPGTNPEMSEYLRRLAMAKLDFDFLTNEPKLIIRQELLAGAAVTSNNDFGFLTLKKDSDATSLQILADTNSTMVPTNPLDGANSFALRETNYLTYSTTLSAGTYKLCLGVANAGDTLNASGLLADAISVTGGSTVPLPAAVLVAPLGIAAAGLFGKRLRRARIA